MTAHEYAASLPKLDLHHHFDGAFDIAHLYREAQRRNLPQGALSAADFAARCRVRPGCRSLTEFLAVFEFFYDIAQDADFLREEAASLPRRMAETGVIYLETRFGPHLFSAGKLSATTVTEAVLDGLDEDAVVPVRLLLCAMRNAPVSQVEELVALYEKYQRRGVCGIDLAGDESRYACREYAPVFARAQEMNVPVTIHAGEAAGPQSVLDALDLFHARRIGHGIRAVEDPRLLERLAHEKITLEVCLTSNLQTGNAASYEAHPFQQLRRAGVPVTVNTDDPTVSGIDLNHEWETAIARYTLSSIEQKELLLNSVAAAFCDEKLRGRLRQQVESFL